MKPPKLPTTLRSSKRTYDLLSTRMFGDKISAIIDYIINYDDYFSVRTRLSFELKKDPGGGYKGTYEDRQLPLISAAKLQPLG